MARTKEFNEDQALDKAIEIFWHKGYNGTSAQDLVTHLGLSRSSLYDTFGDKRAIVYKIFTALSATSSRCGQRTFGKV
ncbi:TetR/AcrR family transcriptional regulator [Flavobacterium ginsengisoli]|uniref:TetR/AcrR family transcriptional regulator n=1 Tax=Flavobacterium ginsengisoli TaxID=871694 RepID=UPI002414FEAA|nr:TetR/AcrR family transcriptional regulator [Flavobacterium ginsengisoli]